MSLGLLVKVGSRDESEAEYGVSHFIEHMAFKGTRSYNAKQLSELMDGLGGELNAYTGKDCTLYYARVLPEDAEPALDVLYELCFEPLLRQEDVEREREVILAELRAASDDTEDRAQEMVEEVLWDTPGLGHGVLGSARSLATISSTLLKAFRARHYHPTCITALAAGPLPWQEVERLFERRLTAVPGDARPPTVRTLPVSTPRSGRRLQQRPSAEVSLCLGFGGLPPSDPQCPAQELLLHVLGGGPSSRLFQKVREERGWAYSVYAYQSNYADVSTIGIYTGLEAGRVGNALELLRQELRLLAEAGVGEDELARAKKQIEGGLVFSLETTVGWLQRMADGESWMGSVPEVDEQVARIRQVACGQLQGLAQRLFGQQRGVLTAVGPWPKSLSREAAARGF